VPAVTSERLAIGLLFVVIATLACLAPTQTDTWWHLRAGLDIWRTHAVSLRDTYSYTAAGQFWPNHEWLTEAVFFALYWLGGLPALTGFCAAVLVMTWALSWQLTRGEFEVRFILFASSLVTAAGAFAIRPQVFSMAGFMITCALLVTSRTRWLPLLFVIWTNLHGAVALGLAAVLATLCADVVFHRKVPRSLTLVAAGCFAATFASPLGVHLWPSIVESVKRSRVNQLIEWQPPDMSPGLWPFWGIACGLVVAVVWWRRLLDDRTLKLTAIALAILPLALTSRRNVSVFLLVAVPALTALARPRESAQRARTAAGEHTAVNAAILSVAAIIGVAVVVLAWRAPAPSLGWRPIAEQAVEAIVDCGEPIYNTYGEGGVLIWFVPQRKVFIDNRQDPYPMDLLVANNQFEVSGKYDGIFGQYGVRCAVVPPSSPTWRQLRAAADWSERYHDARWAVFRRVP
jgi:hypothetical protein